MMLDLDDLLSKAESAPTPSMVVSVCLNPEIAERRAALIDALEQAKKADSREPEDQRLGAPAPASNARTKKALGALRRFDQKAEVALVDLRFTRMPGDEWAELTSAYPMRADVALDRHYGYNFDAVSTLAARRSGVILTDEGEQLATPEQWARMFRILSGHDVEKIRDVVWTLNEYGPQQHIQALVKDSGAA